MKFSKSIIAILALLMALCLTFTGCDFYESSYNEQNSFSPDALDPDAPGQDDDRKDPANKGDSTQNTEDLTEDRNEPTDDDGNNDSTDDNGNNGNTETPADKDPICELLGVPFYSGKPWVAVNGNKPTFTADEITTVGYEFFSELDNLGRCGYVMACVGREMMPTE